ncbi:uncharacterized protein LOC110466650 [Mizuhopecten yessoensis]|uniref:uncharacterized protein LOC110466650 n=1 Tax=Mizuhopecten yessoensis TaxID=6573 RepID=UPI000B45E2B2|nr:uncharacterized protein LOC110466650 [Mizuhopecten yessoensis]
MAGQVPVPGCTRHPGMGFVYVCTYCQHDLLCMKCMVDNHKGHEVELLTDYLSGQRREIEKSRENLANTEFSKLEKDLSDTDTQIHENGKSFQKIRESIRRQGNAMKTEIDNLIEKSIKHCDDMEKKHVDILNSFRTELSQYLNEDKETKLDRCQQVLTSGTNVEVISFARDTLGTSIVPPTLGTLPTAGFKAGTIYSELLQRMLGTITEDGDDQQYQTITECTVKSQFTHSKPITAFSTTGDEAWLSLWKDEDIYRVDQTGKVNEKVECGVKVMDTALSPSAATLWFCCQDDHTVREVTSSGSIVTRFSVTNKPLSLCITGDNTVVVGMKGCIRVYTTDGREVASARAGGPCKQEVVSPYYMAYCTQTGGVAAVDTYGVGFDNYMAGKEPEKQPRIIVMDKHLNMKFHTTQIGTGKSNGNKFYPRSVCFDRACNVLFTENVSKSVLLIDGCDGHYLRTIYTGTSYSVPWNISLQEDGTLWITDSRCGVKVITYK